MASRERVERVVSIENGRWFYAAMCLAMMAVAFALAVPILGCKRKPPSSQEQMDQFLRGKELHQRLQESGVK